MPEPSTKPSTEQKFIYTFTDADSELIKIFLPKFEIDMNTMKQIKQMSARNVLKHIRIMPDCHRGHGCCVGLTAEIEDKIYPRYVGVDIGCGISLLPFHIQMTPIKIQQIEEAIRKIVPMGNGELGLHSVSQMTQQDWEWLVCKCNQDLEYLKEKTEEQYPEYAFPNEITRTWIEQMVIRNCKTSVKTLYKSIGTLGGGNHYVEINKDSVFDTQFFITVHSGSRSIGRDICCHHQLKIDENCRLDYNEIRKEEKRVSRTYKDAKVRKKIMDDIITNMKNELHARYLEGHEMLDYLVDMIVGQNIASLNRQIMIRKIIEEIFKLDQSVEKFDHKKIMETRHNYIDFKRFILRKGSISAEKGEKCIISLNMRDGILLCEGKGNEDWNYSSAHGCGRILSRAKVGQLNMKTFEKEMEGVYSTCVREETLDESPMAYRNVDLIKKCLVDSVDIIAQMKPVINCKGF